MRGSQFLQGAILAHSKPLRSDTSAQILLNCEFCIPCPNLWHQYLISTTGPSRQENRFLWWLGVRAVIGHQPRGNSLPNHIHLPPPANIPHRQLITDMDDLFIDFARLSAALVSRSNSLSKDRDSHPVRKPP